MTPQNDTAKLNILIVANHYAVCSARYATDAFTRLGHTVRHVGPAMGRNIWGMQVPEEYEWKQDSDFMEWVNGELKFDLHIVMDSDSSVLDNPGFKFTKEPTVVWGLDNHVRDYRRPYFDHYFLAHRSVSVMEWGDTRYTNLLPVAPGFNEFAGKPYEDMTWLPCAYDPVAFPPSPIAWADREFDVACLGYMYPQRHILVNAMKQAGLKVISGTGLVYDNYASAYHNSRVSLCVSAASDLAIRIFETAAMGCAVVSDPLADLSGFKGHPVIEYRSVDEAVEKVMALQSQPEIGAKCTQWAAPETWDKRAEVVIKWYNERK